MHCLIFEEGKKLAFVKDWKKRNHSENCVSVSVFHMQLADLRNQNISFSILSG
jgi:hypothetical protein